MEIVALIGSAAAWLLQLITSYENVFGLVLGLALLFGFSFTGRKEPSTHPFLRVPVALFTMTLFTIIGFTITAVLLHALTFLAQFA